MATPSLHWPDRYPRSEWRRIVAAFGPALLALITLPILIWIANRLAAALDDSAQGLKVGNNVSHAVLSGVNVAMLGIVLVMVFCGVYGAAGWAVARLIQGVLMLWNSPPNSLISWAVELGALSCLWGAGFYVLHSGLLAPRLPACAQPLLDDSLLLWFGLPGLLYAWAAALRQGEVI